jgi:hypothetical protein
MDAIADLFAAGSLAFGVERAFLRLPGLVLGHPRVRMTTANRRSGA